MANNSTGHDPHIHGEDVPLPADDDAGVEEELFDVDVNNSVSSEYPETVGKGEGDLEESRDGPASDPESGA